MPDEARHLLGLAARRKRRTGGQAFDLAAFPEVVRVYAEQAGLCRANPGSAGGVSAQCRLRRQDEGGVAKQRLPLGRRRCGGPAIPFPSASVRPRCRQDCRQLAPLEQPELLWDILHRHRTSEAINWPEARLHARLTATEFLTASRPPACETTGS